MKQHWDKVYDVNESEKLGWYEETPEKCLELFDKCNINKQDAVIDIGCGTSSFIENLLDKGFTNLIGLDISEIALEKFRQMLGKKSSSVKLILDNIGNPEKVQKLHGIALWHDRAVLHFLLDYKEQQNYLLTLKSILRKNGYAIIATFNLSGAKKCSGLNTKNYDKNMLAEFLGSDFKLLESFDYIYRTPFGSERPYVYTLFKKIF